MYTMFILQVVAKSNVCDLANQQKICISIHFWVLIKCAI